MLTSAANWLKIITNLLEAGNISTILLDCHNFRAPKKKQSSIVVFESCPPKRKLNMTREQLRIDLEMNLRKYQMDSYVVRQGS